METVLLKLSDYGISQFAATQGARGLVGTPGFMAPEILKYHGKEVRTHCVTTLTVSLSQHPPSLCSITCTLSLCV